MAYTRVNWEDLPSTNTPRNATNLNNMDAQIKENDEKLNGTKPMGSIVVDDVSGKNLFDGSSMIELNGQVRRYSDGVIVSVSGYYGIKVPVKANTTYIISSNLADRDKISNLCYFNGTTYISGEAFGSGSLSFTTPNNCNYITFALSNEYTWCQLEVGSEATPYTPYKNFDNTAYVLWTNSNPTSNIDNATNFNLSLSNYNYYEIIYNLSTSGTNISMATGKIPKGKGTILSVITSGATSFNGLQRNINYTNDTTLSSGQPYSFNNTSRTVDASVLIPIMIIGHK